MVYFDEEKQNQKLREIEQKEQEDLARILANKYGITYADLTGRAIDTDALGLIDERSARDAEVAAFNLRGRILSVGAKSPGSPETKRILKGLEEEGYDPEIYIISEESLEKAWSRYKDITYAEKTSEGLLDIASEEIEKILSAQKSNEDVAQLVKEAYRGGLHKKTTRILEITLGAAIALSASDVHIEPEENAVRLRMRFDGLLRDITDFDHHTYKLMLSRIKLLSGVVLNVTGDAQDGRFSITIGSKDIEVRTSVLPGAYGESIVMRILNPDSISVGIEELGMQPDLLEIMLEEIKKPNGMILNTGPTGSGKTTTLYSFLQNVHRPGIKIITIENPIEYHLEGIVQTQVDKKENYTFEQGLKSSLRQDPDIIMVGEIRTPETASTAVNAALTGHLVFSTLHTNNAAGTFTRLVDLEINPGILGSALNIAMAQRLIRKLVPEMCEERNLTEAEKDMIRHEFIGNSHEEEVARLLRDGTVLKPREGKEVEAYKGRLGVFEAVRVTDKIEKVLKEGVTETAVIAAARDQGILTMKQDAYLKVLQKITDFSEVERVLGS